MHDIVIAGAAVVDADGARVDLDVGIDAGVIADVAPSLDGRTRIDAGGKWLLPGFIDQHVHGASGADPLEGGLDAMAEALRRTGVTSFYATCATDDWATMLAFTRDVAASKAKGLLGAHLEGPFLNPIRRGVHPERLLRNPSVAEMRELLAAGSVRHVTIAPELDGASDVIDLLVESDVTVAVGHTDATYEVALDAFTRGARVLTHAFNAMRPMTHRDPGPLAAAIDGGAICELIGDGAHVHAPAARLLMRAAPVALITDGIPVHQGTWRGHTLTSDGVVARTEDGTIGGSVMPMDEMVRGVHDMGATLHDLATMTSFQPAKAHGIDDRKGRIAPGYDADLVLLDDRLRVVRTMSR